jgi:malate synthase
MITKQSKTAKTFLLPEELTITGNISQAFSEILTPDALEFVSALHERFEARRRVLLETRKQEQQNIDNGILPCFLPESAMIRNSEWKCQPVPKDLEDRRVEITGPVERKMIINALNSGAKVFMADFEDSNSPGWDNTIQGQINIRDAIKGTISYTNENGKEYTLNQTVATLMIRPRGWHMTEKHILFNGEPVSASLLDFGLYLFHNAKQLIANGSGPYFYLPKIENSQEAKLWDDVFVFAQNYLGIPNGTIKATVLVETILAPFQLHEILWELRNHCAGLNCGRWDYIFSFIKKFRNVPGYIFPERGQVTMTVPFMRAYTQLVVQTCHKRGVHAIGGMAAQIPVKGNSEANENALEKVRADKLREVNDGHDGTWVAHPGLVPIAMDIFNDYMPAPNQIETKPRAEFSCTEADLLQLPEGTITEEGLRLNINVGILYLESWLRGNGAAALYNLMEDAATAEICRTQVWQWIHNHALLNDGRKITHCLYEDLRDDEIKKIRHAVGSKTYQDGKFIQAICIFNRLVVQDKWEDFLTLPAYELID